MTAKTDDDGLMEARTPLEKERAKQERRVSQYVTALESMIYMGQLKTADQRRNCCNRENLMQTKIVQEFCIVNDWPDNQESPWDIDLDDSLSIGMSVEKDADDVLKTFVDRATNGIYYCRNCDQSYNEEEAAKLPRN